MDKRYPKMACCMAVLALALMGCVQQTVVQPPGNGTDTLVAYEGDPETVIIYEEQDAGRAVFTITDDPVRLETVNELWVSVDQVEVQTLQGAWVEVSSGQHRYDLLQLREEGEQGILADVALSPGTYQQVRLTVSDVEVIDDAGAHDAVLASGTLQFTAPFEVDANGVTVVQFDFDLEQSLHLAAGGQYVLLPVIRVLAFENAGVQVLASQLVVVRGGTEREIVVLGTDTSGQVAAGTRIPLDVTVRVEPGTNTIVVMDREGGTGGDGSGQSGGANGSMNGSMNGSAGANTTVNGTGGVRVGTNATVNVTAS